MEEKTEKSPHEWETVYQVEGLKIYAQAPTPRNTFLLQNNKGAILGRLFRKMESVDDNAAVEMLSADESDKITTSRGSYLTDRFWGSYVAVLPSSDEGLLIGRDCSGLQLSYMAWTNGVFLAFSNLDSLPFLEALPKDINWGYLAATATY